MHRAACLQNTEHYLVVKKYLGPVKKRQSFGFTKLSHFYHKMSQRPYIIEMMHSYTLPM